MPHDVRLARLGDTADAVVIVEWLVELGDHVSAGDPLVRVETDKVEVDVESEVAGTVTERFGDAGDELRTGALVCRIEAVG